MSLEAQWSDMTADTVTYAPLSTGVTGYGAPAFSTSPTTYTARVEPGTRVVVNSQGVEEVATAMVYIFSTSATLGPQGKLTLPDGRIPKILSIEHVSDDEGQHHIEIAVQAR